MTTLDVTGIGNALGDIAAHCEDDFLQQHGIPKGTMQLIGQDKAESLYAHMGPISQMSGGSTANTIACLAALGGRCGFIGRVRDDALGSIFAHDIRSLGVSFSTAAATEGPTTGRCYVLISPDGERTMNTFLGVAPNLSLQDIHAEDIARSKVFYIEGYLWSPPEAKKAILEGIRISHRAGNRAALTLSDVFCVDMWRDEFHHLIQEQIDIVFANEHEAMALTSTTDFDAAIQIMHKWDALSVVTRSEKGAVVLSGGTIHTIAPEPVARVVDATGAGDAFAAGFLYGLTQGRSLQDCGRLGSVVASSIISQIGPRPQSDLKKLIETV